MCQEEWWCTQKSCTKVEFKDNRQVEARANAQAIEAKVKANVKVEKKGLGNVEVLDKTHATHEAQTIATIPLVQPNCVTILVQPNYVTLEQVQLMLETNDDACQMENMVVLANSYYTLLKFKKYKTIGGKHFWCARTLFCHAFSVSSKNDVFLLIFFYLIHTLVNPRNHKKKNTLEK